MFLGTFTANISWPHECGSGSMSVNRVSEKIEKTQQILISIVTIVPARQPLAEKTPTPPNEQSRGLTNTLTNIRISAGGHSGQ